MPEGLPSDGVDAPGSVAEAGILRSDLVRLVYDDLRRQAHLARRRHRAGGTFQTTTLVQDCVLRLLKGPGTDWTSRAHFLAAAALALRHILVDRARRQKADKRGGGWNRVELHLMGGDGQRKDVDVVALHDALEDLSTLDERMARIVEYRFFAGMTVKEVAHVLSVSVSTVESDWRTARAWLARVLGKEEAA